MPGSTTTQDRKYARVGAHPRFAFRCDNGVGVPIDSFAARWLAYAYPYRRFVPGLATEDARLGADAVRYSFIVVDLHHLLLANLPGAPSPKSCQSRKVASAFGIRHDRSMAPVSQGRTGSFRRGGRELSS